MTDTLDHPADVAAPEDLDRPASPADRAAEKYPEAYDFIMRHVLDRDATCFDG